MRQLKVRAKLRAAVENEMGTITGMGQYSDREKVTVRAEKKKEGPYKLRWFYEQEEGASPGKRDSGCHQQ